MDMDLCARNGVFDSYEVDPDTGCWNWNRFRTTEGYGRFKLGGVELGAHRAFYMRFVGPIPERRMVRHMCNNRACVNPGHLTIGTNADNVRDREEFGKSARGSGNGFSIFNERGAVAVVRLHAAGVSVDALANAFGVRPGAVYNILSGATWSHATGIKRDAA